MTTSGGAPPVSERRVERKTIGADPHRLRRISMGQLGIRFAFGAAISAVAGAVGEALGERAGGVLLAFPAILPAALTLIERQEGTSSAVSDVRGAIAGAVGLLGFAVTAMLLATRLPVLAAIAAAAGAWGALGFGLYFGAAALAGRLGKEQYLPEVAVREAAPLVACLRARRRTLAIAESCTGGALAALLTAVPKASQAVAGGVVAYTDEMKRELLGVPSSVLEQEGAVSEATAEHMAEGVRQRMHTDMGIAITGVIGTPVDGEAPGTIYVCAAGPRGSVVTRLEGETDPERARGEALRIALRVGLKVLEE
jgi:nicotinamide-nucleotide amidase